MAIDVFCDRCGNQVHKDAYLLTCEARVKDLPLENLRGFDLVEGKDHWLCKHCATIFYEVLKLFMQVQLP